MRFVVLLFATLMPLVAWMNQRGVFGPTNGELSDRYPTLVVAAGYAFSIWGLIFLLDIAYGVMQATGARRRDRLLTAVSTSAAAGFALTTLWMPLFSMGFFWACIVVIFGALAATAHAALRLSRREHQGAHRLPWIALSLHAGWLALAAWLNVAQVIVADQLLSTTRMLGWSLAVLLAAAATLLLLNRAMRGNVPFTAAAVWGLVATWVKQSGSPLQGADVAAWAALAVALALVAQTIWMLTRRRETGPQAAMSH